MYDWASATNHQDPTTLKTQLGFLTEDLRNAFQAIGAAISAAKTEEEATKAFRPYADELAALSSQERSRFDARQSELQNGT